MIEAMENQAIDLAREDVAYLRGALGNLLERRDDGWALRRLVGQFQLPSGAQLRVRSPKSSSANIFSWMSYVDPTLRPMKLLGDLDGVADEGDIAALIAILFARTTLTAFRQHGLRRHYLRARVQRSVIRGRIDFAEAVRRGGTGPRIPCIVWDRLPDTPLNRLLCEAVQRLRAIPHLRNSAPRELAEIDGILAGVTRSVDTDLLSGKRPLSRTELPFEDSCALARLIVRSTSLNEGSRRSGVAFMVNLEELFERAVARAFHDFGLEVLEQEPVPYLVKVTGSGWQKRAMYMDAYLPRTVVGPMVVDAKYKSSLSAGNLQQMVTYCSMMGAERGLLVFPSAQLDEHASYHFTPLDDRQRPIQISSADLRTDGATLAEWKANGRSLAESVFSLGRLAQTYETGPRDR